MALPEETERGSILSQAGELAERAWTGEVSRGHHAVERERLRVALQDRAPRRSKAALVVLAAAALLAVSAAAFALFFFEPKLDVAVRSASGGEDGYLAATSTTGAAAQFSDGTNVTVTPGGRARIVEIDPRGARIALEHGHARFRVVHRPRARWSVDAGPFSIAVTGTEFDVDWVGSEGRLSVDLHVGSVIVRGPLAEGGIALRAGQRLEANVAEGRLHIEAGTRHDVDAHVAATEIAAPPAPRTASPTETASPTIAPETAQEIAADSKPESHRALPAGSPGESRAEAEAVREPASRTTTSGSWSERVAAGDFAAVLDDATDRGVDATLARAPLGDLVALADAARYKGRGDLARRTLGAIRSRFPASTDARSAVFHLGRLAEERGKLTEALSSYDRYLAEARNGAFAAEAFGRKLVVTRKAAGDETARSVARDYLARFPKGSYAGLAKELVAAP